MSLRAPGGRRSSIAARLFFLVFGFSVGWFTVTSGVQLALEYRNTRAEVDSNLRDLFSATQAGLVSSLWNIDRGLLQGSLDSLRSVGFLSGAEVHDEMGNLLARWGTAPSGAFEGFEDENVAEWERPLFHRFSLVYRGTAGERPLGTLVLISGLDVLADRVASGGRLILSNYLATTGGFLVILFLGLRRLVARPLGRVTRAIEAYRFDQTALPSLGSVLRRRDELFVLWSSFETLTTTLKETWLQQRAVSAILEEAGVMALVCDADGRIVSSNAQARDRLGGGQPGGTLGDITYGTTSKPLIAFVSELLNAGLPWRAECPVEGADDQELWLSMALLPLDVPDQPRARWGLIVEDVSSHRLTDRYRMERDTAREAARTKGLFLANLSHEIRTPMNAVLGLSTLALGEDLSPKVRGYLAPLERSARVLLAILNDILDASKLEERKVELEVGEFSLAELWDDVAAIARYRAQEKGLTFVLEGHLEAPLLRGDRFRLQQILLNLVSNALKFTEAGRVSMAARPLEGPWWRFEVADTGIGIAKEDQDRLFQSFTQLNPSTTRVYGGTGLGLSIVQKLVELMKGRLGVQSRVGEGSLFWFEVVLPSARQPDGQVIPNWAGLRGLRVLLVEDNHVNQLVAREILAKWDIVPQIASNGQEAVEMASSRSPDIVLMDLQMPVMDGWEAARRIRARHPAESLPILAMTAHTLSDEKERCQEAGMQGLIPKPVEPEVLFATLSQWCLAKSKTGPASIRAPGGSG